MLAKNRRNNAKSTIVVCLIGAVMLMSILTGIMMIESGRSEKGGALSSKKTVGNSKAKATRINIIR